METSNIRPGAAPINAATIGGPTPAWNTVPMTPDAHVTERFTLINANTMTYEMTFSDPKVWTKPFTLRVDWPRNDKYEFFEYACHEGDEQVRNYIVANRAPAREKSPRARLGPRTCAAARRPRPIPGGETPAAQRPRAEAAQPARQ
ncbi:MAG: hypothetical protein WDN45_01800 [Caulobacteraceae bacterium]